ncbi:MAG: hypothetical protein CMI25_00750 [Opitutae bacterium]|nr:hypothetical protein [Opitutae bacterium]
MALKLLLEKVLIEKNTSFPLYLEQRFSKLSANINLPPPNSGLFFFRLIRLPKEGVETSIDLYSKGSRVFLKVSRILHPLRDIDRVSKHQTGDSSGIGVPVEISSGLCDADEPIVREILRGTPMELESKLKGDPDGSHYFIFFTDSRECVASGITDPHHVNKCELWTRLICYSYGAEQIAHRRFYRRDLSLSS